MSESIFSPENVDRLTARVERVEAGDAAAWGKMSAGQMLRHCLRAAQVATGDFELPRVWLGRLFGRLAKRSAVGPKPFRKGLPTAPQFVVREATDVEDAKRELLALLARFRDEGESAVTCSMHPFFGPMSTAEWDVILWKHLDHHLRQFGHA